MKTLKIIGLAVLILIIVVLGARFLSGPEDSWICQNGQWIKHGNPSSPQPTAACGGQTPGDKSDLIVVNTPKPNDIVTSPLTITGKARGNWFFEASFPVQLVEVASGEVLAIGIAQAEGDWMTTEFVPFIAELEFGFRDRAMAIADGLLVIQKDNPSGLPQYDDSISVPVLISITDSPGVLDGCIVSGCSREICSDQEVVTACVYKPEYACYSKSICKKQSDGKCGWTENYALGQCIQSATAGSQAVVKAYFNNNKLDPEYSCNKVFSVERQIVKTEAIARAALEELLQGPTDEEKSQGYFTSINPGVRIQKLTITGGTAKVDFDETMEQGMGGSCRVSAIRAQITETLKQFSTVKNVIISVNGRTEDILQP